MGHIREAVIAEAKSLAKKGQFPRFFCISGELWECYQSEYLPDIGERAWFAEKITPHNLSDEVGSLKKDAMK